MHENHLDVMTSKHKLKERQERRLQAEWNRGNKLNVYECRIGPLNCLTQWRIYITLHVAGILTKIKIKYIDGLDTTNLYLVIFKAEYFGGLCI